MFDALYIEFSTENLIASTFFLILLSETII